MKDKEVKPRYADQGRKHRVEQIGGRTELAWFEHCKVFDMRMEPHADDRASTRESCCKPDVLTDGQATELMKYMKPEKWKDEPFPFPFLKVPYHKLKYGEEYPDGRFVMMNYAETYACSVSMTEEVDHVEYCVDNDGNRMKLACFAIEKCHRFKLGKLDKLNLN